MWNKEIPPKDDGITLLYNNNYIMLATFSSPFYDFHRIFNIGVSFTYKHGLCLLWFVQSENKFTKELTRYRKGVKHSLSTQNGTAF